MTLSKLKWIEMVDDDESLAVKFRPWFNQIYLSTNYSSLFVMQEILLQMCDNEVNLNLKL